MYDRIGTHYSATRRTDPRIAQQLHAALHGATRIVNIGAGSGSYEPENVALVAVEPSLQMIAQRKPNAHRVVQAAAEKLPFDDNTFSHAMTVLSMHHWQRRDLAFAEIKRVTTDTFVAITWDPESEPFWLTRDYFPQIQQRDAGQFPTVAELRKHFSNVTVHPLPIPSDCQDGFLAAFWQRPRAYLDAAVRRSISPFARLDDPSPGLRKLQDDLDSGVWHRKNRAILERSSLDVGYRLITASVKSA